VKLYVCYGTWTAMGHACGRAHQALVEAGHRPDVIRSYGNRLLPDFPFNRSRGRRDAKRLTGTSTVPVLGLDDGKAISGSEAIVTWARQNARA
jgi:hypothetical protein